MNYQVLARKWRPRNFQEMVGQEHVLRMLTNALTHKRLHHAYLYTGTRGVGKTTLARILAKCLNCESGITATPCGQCHACQAIDAGRFLDLIEVDAASRTKVEDTRELLENIQYAPSQGRYKIYLIDEVHMLSGHSFNALLKTLEEPPPHVIFILATTDPKKLPITILSRCLQFNLKRVSCEQIAEQLKRVCEAEKIAFDQEALALVANAADGSMRDALSLLDQTIAFCGDKITAADTRNMLGSIEQDHLFRLLDALSKNDGKLLLSSIAELADYAPDFESVLQDLLSLLHQINLAHIVPESISSDPVKKFAKLFSADEIQLYYQIALIGKRDLLLAPNALLGFEMVMLRMLAFKPAEIQAANEPVKHTMEKPETQETSDWTILIKKLELTGMAHALASNCTLQNKTENKIELLLSKKHEALLNKKTQERIAEALTNYFKKEMSVEISLSTEELNSPAKIQQQQQEVRQTNAANAIKSDSQVKKMMDMFDATLDEDSVKAID